MSDHLATVVILTFNGETYLRRILEALRDQQLDGEFDVLVIDSGSTDTTLDIVSDFPEVRVHHIDKADFGHGRTRNLAASMSRGEFTAYLTHDAIPVDSSWLRHLLEPLRTMPRVAGVYGLQVPRPRCVPLLKYEIRGVFGSAGVGHGVTVDAPGWAPTEIQARATFYSDVNSAARTSVLLGEVPYRDVPYAEDQYFGADLLESGWWKAFSPMAAVEHSNDLTVSEYRRRIFDEGVALSRLGFPVPTGGAMRTVVKAMRGIVGDTLRIARDPDYSWRRRLYWWAVNPAYQVAKWSAYRRVSKVDIDNEAVVEAHSLEASRRRDQGA
ncbi:glycosyltransferase family 2 protein [Demequina sp.]|uniref:glycosyltransferase family A protein n=1 Tax=Demequina sp. TaxID=2050685 RepID=UPI0025BC4676|nr:glycosyltransferase family 2 protein [Demequina sp.]